MTAKSKFHLLDISKLIATGKLKGEGFSEADLFFLRKGAEMCRGWYFTLDGVWCCA